MVAKTFLAVDQLRADQLLPVRALVKAFVARELDMERIAAAVEGRRLSAWGRGSPEPLMIALGG